MWPWKQKTKEKKMSKENLSMSGYAVDEKDAEAQLVKWCEKAEAMGFKINTASFALSASYDSYGYKSSNASYIYKEGKKVGPPPQKSGNYYWSINAYIS